MRKLSGAANSGAGKLHRQIRGQPTGDAGCGWASVDMALMVGERVGSTCSARIALPTDADDNPWARKGDAWQPALGR